MPDWGQAIGTTGALVYIGFQYHSDRVKDLQQRQNDAEAKRQAERIRRDAEAAQARLISFRRIFELGGETAWMFTVHNDSDRAIRDISLSVLSSAGRELLPSGSQVTPGGMIFTPVNGLRLEVVRPGQQAELRFEFEGSYVEGHEDDPLPDEGCSWFVTFTDAEGLRWKRDGESDMPDRILAD